MSDLIEILPSLIEKTRDKKLVWDVIGGVAFIATLGEYNIVLNASKGISCNVTLRDASGNSLDQLTAIKGTKGFETVNELYELARRQALNIDGAISSVKRHLDLLK